jgi:hypothetical protein
MDKLNTLRELARQEVQVKRTSSVQVITVRLEPLAIATADAVCELTGKARPFVWSQLLHSAAYAFADGLDEFKRAEFEAAMERRLAELLAAQSEVEEG